MQSLRLSTVRGFAQRLFGAAALVVERRAPHRYEVVVDGRVPLSGVTLNELHGKLITAASNGPA